jgi:hypothetical protein
MPEAAEFFHRDCQVSDATGAIAPLKNPSGDDYLARTNISCRFFDKDSVALEKTPPRHFLASPSSWSAT